MPPTRMPSMRSSQPVRPSWSARATAMPMPAIFARETARGVITVAATNRDGGRAYYSNYGSIVEISAPGGETIRLNDSNGVLSTLNTGTQGPVADTYVYYQGTSMAAPHVAGVASLLYSRKPSLTPAEVLTILQSTVTGFPGGSTCNTSICGSGIVNAGAAVAAVANPVPTITGLNPFLATPGGPAFTLTVNGTGFVNVRGAMEQFEPTTTYVSSTQLTAAITAGVHCRARRSECYRAQPVALWRYIEYGVVRRGQPCADHHWSQSVLGHTG